MTGETFDVFDIEAAHLPALAAYMRATDIAAADAGRRDGRGGLHVFTPLTAPQGRAAVPRRATSADSNRPAGSSSRPGRDRRQYAGVRSGRDGRRRGTRLDVRPRRAKAGVRRQAHPAGAESHRRAEAARGARADVARSGGQPNDLLFWAACRALEEGSSPRAVAGALTEAARDCGLVRDDGSQGSRGDYRERRREGKWVEYATGDPDFRAPEAPATRSKRLQTGWPRSAARGLAGRSRARRPRRHHRDRRQNQGGRQDDVDADAVRAVLDGWSSWLAHPARKVMYVTEQPRQTFSEALRRAGLDLRGEELQILFRADLGAAAWPQFVGQTRVRATRCACSTRSVSSRASTRRTTPASGRRR